MLDLAKYNVTELINAGIKNSYVIVRSNEIIIGDTKDINNKYRIGGVTNITFFKHKKKIVD